MLDQRKAPMAMLARPKATAYATAAPAIPSGGKGLQPSVSAPESGMCKSAAAASTSAGMNVLPLPRRMLASVFASHTSTAPPKSTLE